MNSNITRELRCRIGKGAGLINLATLVRFPGHAPANQDVRPTGVNKLVTADVSCKCERLFAGWYGAYASLTNAQLLHTDFHQLFFVLEDGARSIGQL